MADKLEQPAQEPVAWIDHLEGIKTVVWKERDYPDIGTKLYTHPAPSWQGLDAVEVSNIFISKEVNGDATQFARAIEQALRIKNEQTN